MAVVITRDDVDEVELSGQVLAASERADQLVEWAESDDVELADDVSPRSLYVSASELYGYSGDRERQWEMIERASAAPGTSAIDVRAIRAVALLERGDDVGALDELAGLRKDRTGSHYTCHYVAEQLELREMLGEAERWCNIGLRLLEDLDPDMLDAGGWDLLLVTRRSVRGKRGRAHDHYDDEADAIERLHAGEG